MNDTVPDQTTPTTLPARDLTPNRHIVDDSDVYEVRYVLHYRHTDGRDYVNLTVVRADTGRPWQLAYLADEPVTLASPERIADAGQQQRREELAVKLRAAADQLHRLANDVLLKKLPAPRWAVGAEVSGITATPDDLERWAAHLGQSVQVGASNHIPYIQTAVGSLGVRLQADPDASIELLTPEQWQERTGVRVLDADGWSDGKSWSDPIWYPEWLRRMSASTVQQRTVTGALDDPTTVPARDLTPGQHVADRGTVRRVTDRGGMVEVTYETGLPLLYPPDHEVTVTPAAAQAADATRTELDR